MSDRATVALTLVLVLLAVPLAGCVGTLGDDEPRPDEAAPPMDDADGSGEPPVAELAVRQAGQVVARTGGTGQAEVGVEIRFSAEGSRDPAGNLTAYRWTFDDGAQATGPEAVHTYSEPGSFDVTLVVEAADGDQATARATLEIRSLEDPASAPGVELRNVSVEATSPRTAGVSFTVDSDGEVPVNVTFGQNDPGRHESWTGNVSGSRTVRLAGLTPDSGWRFRVRAGTPENGTTAVEGSVTTPDRRDEEIPSLSWAALKTGFRLIVTWQTDAAVTGTLEYRVGDGSTQTITETVPQKNHVFVVDRLETTRLLTFTASYETDDGAVTSEPHTVHLVNAHRAYDVGEQAYRMNLVVLANERARGMDIVRKGIRIFAERLWDASDGAIRAGDIYLLRGDLKRSEGGLFSCGIADSYGVTPACSHLVDVVFSWDNYPFAAGAAWRGGIGDHRRPIYMNNMWERWPGEIGAVLLHELGHYAFWMDDLYVDLGAGPECFDQSTGISVMGADRRATEFDDATTRCPNEDALDDYTPSWTYLRKRYDEIPARPGAPDPGPQGDGGIFELHDIDNIEDRDAPT